MKLTLLASLLLTTILAAPLYTVKDVSGAGTLTLTATKEYNIWSNSGNKTIYTVEIVSPLIRYSSQEIRVSIQWQWKTKLGISNERVAFYGEVGKGRFDEFRVDRHIEVNGSYQFSNFFMPVIPKDSTILPPQTTEDQEKYIFREAENPEISIDNQTAQFSFIVGRDEPYSEDSSIWINWGVFDNSFDTDQDKVYGLSEAHNYEIFLTYSDYYDRILVNVLYWTMGLTSLSFWGALPMQLVPLLVLFFYVYWVPISIIIAPPSQNFTFDNFFTEVVLRWQGGTTVALLTIISADLVSYAPFGYIAYIYYTNNNSFTLTNTQWLLFAGQSIVAYLAQIFLTFFVSLIAILFLSE